MAGLAHKTRASPESPRLELPSDLDRVLGGGAESVRGPDGQLDRVAARPGVGVADLLASGALAVPERPAIGHDRAARHPAPRAVERDLGARGRAGRREREHGVRVVNARLTRVDRAWLLAACREERLVAARDQQVRRDAGAVARVGDGDLLDAAVVAP